MNKYFFSPQKRQNRRPPPQKKDIERCYQFDSDILAVKVAGKKLYIIYSELNFPPNVANSVLFNQRIGFIITLYIKYVTIQNHFISK